MKIEELRHTLLNGEPDILKRVEAWHSDKIKANNRTWVLIFILTSIIWIGYICILTDRNATLSNEHNQCDSIHKVDKLTIDMQHETLKTAVYFRDIIVK